MHQADAAHEQQAQAEVTRLRSIAHRSIGERVQDQLPRTTRHARARLERLDHRKGFEDYGNAAAGERGATLLTGGVEPNE